MSSSDQTVTGFKDAYASALDFARTAIGDRNFTLEEVDRDTHRGRDVWVITLGYREETNFPESAVSSLADLARGRRNYKQFLIDVQTGEVLAMKLREPAIL